MPRGKGRGQLFLPIITSSSIHVPRNNFIVCYMRILVYMGKVAHRVLYI